MIYYSTVTESNNITIHRPEQNNGFTDRRLLLPVVSRWFLINRFGCRLGLDQRMVLDTIYG